MPRLVFRALLQSPELHGTPELDGPGRALRIRLHVSQEVGGIPELARKQSWNRSARSGMARSKADYAGTCQEEHCLQPQRVRGHEDGKDVPACKSLGRHSAEPGKPDPCVTGLLAPEGGGTRGKSLGSCPYLNAIYSLHVGGCRFVTACYALVSLSGPHLFKFSRCLGNNCPAALFSI